MNRCIGFFFKCFIQPFFSQFLQLVSQHCIDFLQNHLDHIPFDFLLSRPQSLVLLPNSTKNNDLVSLNSWLIRMDLKFVQLECDLSNHWNSSYLLQQVVVYSSENACKAYEIRDHHHCGKLVHYRCSVSADVSVIKLVTIELSIELVCLI